MIATLNAAEGLYSPYPDRAFEWHAVGPSREILRFAQHDRQSVAEGGLMADDACRGDHRVAQGERPLAPT